MTDSPVFCSSRTLLPSKTHLPIDLFHSVHYKLHHLLMKMLQRLGWRERARIQIMDPVFSHVSVCHFPRGGVMKKKRRKKLRVLVAGGGIGGLVFALGAKRKGFEVVVFERDMSAIRGEGEYRRPIQTQSNALAALEAIDLEMADEVMKAGCITGQRINGLVDRVPGNWYIKFDTFTPAVERGLPVTRVISRMTLQRILADAVGEDVILNGSNVISFQEHSEKVSVILENGEQFEGDLLVGADGIGSKVRTTLFWPKEVTYSGYTCYTGIADFIPPDIDTIGYQVFLGSKQYFVSSDVGSGKMQWYAFHKEPTATGGTDKPNGWCDKVVDLLLSTDEAVIFRRDIFDLTPNFRWGKGHVTLLGDSVHAMQPNLGQGGCMAIEDSYQLALELDKAWRRSTESGNPVDIISSLRRYENARRFRVVIIHGLGRMAAIMASNYKAYLGVGLGPLSFLTKYRIPHPGQIVGRFVIKIGMPLMLTWVLGGDGAEALPETAFYSCRVGERLAYIYPPRTLPKFFPNGGIYGASNELQKWFRDGDALERALSGDNEQRRYRVPINFPARFHPSDVIEFGPSKKVAFRVKVMRFSPKTLEEVHNRILQAV